MISKETARDVYNTYQQLEEIEKLKSEMVDEVNKVREREKNREKEHPIPEKENTFGKYGKGMQLGVPDGISSSVRIFSISPELAISVMDEHKVALEKKMRELEVVCKLELNNKV